MKLFSLILTAAMVLSLAACGQPAAPDPVEPDTFAVDLDVPYGNIGCVIMVSFLDSRFGRKKLIASFLCAPLISPVLDAAEGIFPCKVVVTRHRDVAALCRKDLVAAKS